MPGSTFKYVPAMSWTSHSCDDLQCFIRLSLVYSLYLPSHFLFQTLLYKQCNIYCIMFWVIIWITCWIRSNSTLLLLRSIWSFESLNCCKVFNNNAAWGNSGVQMPLKTAQNEGYSSFQAILQGKFCILTAVALPKGFTSIAVPSINHRIGEYSKDLSRFTPSSVKLK